MTNMIDKIAALRAKIPERGATEEEALAALALADKLMTKHGVTEADLKSVEFSRDMGEGQFTQRQKTVHPSQKYCAMSIATFCGVRCWTQHLDRRKKNIKIFGMKGDVVMAEFLLGLVHDAMDRGWKEFLANNEPTEGVSRHTEYWSFMMGFANTINAKLNDLIEARRATRTSSAGTDLVEVKMALVEDAMASMLPDLKLKRTTSRTKVEGGAYGQGQAAGNRVNLQRPIGKQQAAGVRRIA